MKLIKRLSSRLKYLSHVKENKNDCIIDKNLISVLKLKKKIVTTIMFETEKQKFILNSFRNIHQSAKFCDNKTSESSKTEMKNVEKLENKQVPLPGSRKTIIDPTQKFMNVRLIDKWLLVWFKKYKSVNDVPNRIQEGILDHIHSKSRIRIANYLMVFGLIACGYAIWSGKKAVEEGDSLTKRIEERHQRAREEYLRKQSKDT